MTVASIRGKVWRRVAKSVVANNGHVIRSALFDQLRLIGHVIPVDADIVEHYVTKESARPDKDVEQLGPMYLDALRLRAMITEFNPVVHAFRTQFKHDAAQDVASFVDISIATIRPRFAKDINILDTEQINCWYKTRPRIAPRKITVHVDPTSEQPWRYAMSYDGQRAYITNIACESKNYDEAENVLSPIYLA